MLPSSFEGAGSSITAPEVLYMLDAAPSAMGLRSRGPADGSLQSMAMDYLSNLARVLEEVPGEALAQAIALLLEAHAANKRVYVIGNGGSSATASHFVCDLTKTARVTPYPRLKAFALTDNTPLLTAWANDCSYEEVFAEQIRGLVEPGDVVIAISASGNSPNILAGLIAAAAHGAVTIGLLGFDGGAARGLVDVAVHVHAFDYGLVEDTHSALTHAMANALRTALETQARLHEFERGGSRDRDPSASAKALALRS
jgi:D-sedoheptulose 7-phosphate isomerase